MQTRRGRNWAGSPLSHTVRAVSTAKESKPQASDPPPEQSVGFEPIEPLRAHEYVAEQVRRHIALGLIDAGESLPPERELTRIFGVGRGTVQAALRLLEADGLLESRRGAGGGTFVLEPFRDEAAKERSLLELKLSKERILDGIRFRRVVELGAVRLAAEGGPSESELDELRSTIARRTEAKTELDFHRLDTEFHIGLGRASGSKLLHKAVEQARLILNDPILAQPETERWRERIFREHEEILEAVEAGDPEAAAKTMARHLDRTEKSIDAMFKALG